MKFVPSTDFPLAIVVHADRTVLFATFVISMLTGVIFGILPALRASSLAPVAVLKEDTGSASGRLKKARLASAGGRTNFALAAAADLRGTFHPQLHERAVNRSGI